MNLNEMAQVSPQPATDPSVGTTGGKTPASPEQQAQFDMLLGRARQILGESAQEWKDAMQVDPAGAAVQMGTQTLRFLAQESEKAGQPVDPAVLLNVGVQFVKDVTGLANDAGMVPDDQLEPFLQQVMQESMAEYMRMDAEDGLLQGSNGPPPGAQASDSAAQEMNLAQMAQGSTQ